MSNQKNLKEMNKYAAALVLVSVSLGAQAKTPKSEPATVIITAGQSNTDGRILNTGLPEYIQQNRYNYCHWCYGSGGAIQTDGFEIFWPKMVHEARPERWAYDAVTYYWLEQALQKDFYVIKWSLGGTAIDPSCTSTSHTYWCARPDWLAENTSTLTGGKSLLLSLTEEIGLCIDRRLSQLPEGYEIKAFLWHQGESDSNAGERYQDNLKMVVDYVRNYLVNKTGNQAYATLPFIFGTVAHDNKRYDSEVEAAMLALAKEDPDFYLIDMSRAQLQRDQLHFTASSAEYLGVEIYNTLVDLGVAGKEAHKISHDKN